MSKFRQLPVRMKQLPPRIKLLSPAPGAGFSEELVERKGYYTGQRWALLRERQLRRKANRRCFFCGAPAAVLEHLCGHGADAVQVAAALGLPAIDPDWRVRFWTGPFCGTCSTCARRRSGAERHGKLLAWTERWLDGRSAGQAAGVDV